LETESERFEISRQISKEDYLKELEETKIEESAKKAKPEDTEQVPVNKHKAALYTFSRVLDPYLLDNSFFVKPSTKVPLENKYKEVIATDLDWQDFVWSDFSLRVVKKKEGSETECVGTYAPLKNYKMY
jgi:hypothetical protein